MVRESWCLMGVFAHPDDESFGVGGTLAKYARSGVKVSVVTATRGDKGKTGDPPVCAPEELGAVRESELRCACKVLGVSDLEILGYPDKGLEYADKDEVVGKIVHAIRRLRPHVIVTFGPDGVSGHRDHVAISRYTTQAFGAASDRERYPEHFAEGLWPWAPVKLYYTAPSWKLFMALGQEWPQGLENEITTVIDVQDYLEVKWEALRCHRSQNMSVRRYMNLADDSVRAVAGKEYFRLKRSVVERPGGVESDLFAGISSSRN